MGIDDTEQKQLESYQHVQRIESNTLSKQRLHCMPQGKRGRGLPRKKMGQQLLSEDNREWESNGV